MTLQKLADALPQVLPSQLSSMLAKCILIRVALDL